LRGSDRRILRPTLIRRHNFDAKIAHSCCVLFVQPSESSKNPTM